jgi:hypothetical protein
MSEFVNLTIALF